MSAGRLVRPTERQQECGRHRRAFEQALDVYHAKMGDGSALNLTPVLRNGHFEGYQDDEVNAVFTGYRLTKRGERAERELAGSVIAQWPDVDEAFRHAEGKVQGVAGIQMASARGNAARLYLRAHEVLALPAPAMEIAHRGLAAEKPK